MTMKCIVYKGKKYSNYSIDSKGDVYNKDKHKLKPWDDQRGYLLVDITDDKGVSDRIKIHDASAETYHGPKPKGKITQHKDANKHNNSPDNLEYITQKENVAHAQVVVKGKEYLDEEKVSRIKAMLKTKGITEISKDMNLPYHIIRDIKNGKTYK